jgi:hypothetical protein
MQKGGLTLAIKNLPVKGEIYYLIQVNSINTLVFKKVPGLLLLHLQILPLICLNTSP